MLCWIVYFSTYLGRLNYSASLSEIILSERFTKSQAGMIGTGFFLAYGGGQFVSGFLGDRLAPKKMVFTGLFISGICNLTMVICKNPVMMTAIWCVNGLFQALIWSPMIRLMFEFYRTETRMRACVSLNSSVPIGTMAAYGITAAVIWMSGWRMMFLLAGVVLFVISLVWLVGMGRVEAYAKEHGEKEVPPVSEAKRKSGDAGHDFQWKHVFIEAGFLLLMIALFVQGALKDGVTTWVPTYISETYGMSGVLAITSTMIIPVFNLAGVYLASFADSHWFRNEIRTAAAFFGVCGAALFVLWAASGHSMVISFLMLAVATTAMMAVNTMLIAVLPSYFGAKGKASSVSGILNSSVYVGGAASTYGIGALSMIAGWNATILVWFIMAVVSMVLCGAVVKRWSNYRRTLFR